MRLRELDEELRELDDRFLAWRDNRVHRRWDRKGPGWVEMHLYGHPIAAAAVLAAFYVGMFVPSGSTRVVVVAAVGMFATQWASHRYWGRKFDRWRRNREAEGIEVAVPRRPSALEAVGLAVALVAMGATLVWAHGADDGPCAGDLALVAGAEGAVHARWTATCAEQVPLLSMITYRATGSPGDDLDPAQGPFETATCEDARTCALGIEVRLEPGQCVAVLSLLAVHPHAGGPTVDRATDELCLPA